MLTNTNTRMKLEIKYGLEKGDLKFEDFAHIIGYQCRQSAYKFYNEPMKLGIDKILLLEKRLHIDLLQYVK